MNPNNNHLLTLISQVDNTKVTIDKRCARLSTLLKNLQDDYQENVIKVPDIPGVYLSHISEYLNHYIDSDPPKVTKPLAKYDIGLMYGKWEDEYISKFIGNKAVFWELINHSNFIDCESLLDLATSRVAVYIKDFSPQHILEYFGMEEDLLEDEARRIHKEFENKLKVKKM